MKTIKSTIGIALLCLIATSCSKKSTTSKVLYEKDFSTGHSDWKVSGDTIVKQFDLKIADSKEPLKVFWLASKDPDGCMHVSYTRLERVNMDSNIKADSFRADNVICGTDWESTDETRYDQMKIIGNFSRSKIVGKDVKQGNFLIVKGNGEIVVN
ncbi:hypothetical protein NAL32_17410 [Chryseobacterium sp. Ch-15]|uniref:Uncharacterized protein n=1 Tax=Chryseobacterium muglaense TaxID=2893752 RepID=A0A9Q3UW56_9FLAO|nr:hypothetical protein [Chryseobacterium muglaense]MBD3906450.1 hypothetical protein [Chryseobacterium muglaense]MCC9036838.1 hypothetical protein [Chryseobacterium muglaense]MCM2556164.1 hypothetical protein [Chryseobacterium muglaense]